MHKDQTSFKELYKRYAQDVYRFSFWLSGEADTAKDITAETFARVWTSDAETRMESVKAYLFTIARNVYRQQHRRNRAISPITEDIQDDSIRIEQQFEDRSELHQTLAALQKLPDIDRTLLSMRARDEMSYEEIAKATGLSLSAVKVKVFRARAKLSTLVSHFRGANP